MKNQDNENSLLKEIKRNPVKIKFQMLLGHFNV